MRVELAYPLCVCCLPCAELARFSVIGFPRTPFLLLLFYIYLYYLSNLFSIWKDNMSEIDYY